MAVSALIIGIDGWQQYTMPLIRSIRRYNPIEVVIVDNYSQEPYPDYDDSLMPLVVNVRAEQRLSYAQAINFAHSLAVDADWHIVLSNDVLCTGPFLNRLAELPDDVVFGPQLWQEHGLEWIVGWCVCIPRRVWTEIGGWDENYIVSSWEDVDFSVSAVEHGFHLLADDTFPFIHLDQKQRFNLIPDYWRSEAQNVRYFIRKHGIAI